MPPNFPQYLTNLCKHCILSSHFAIEPPLYLPIFLCQPESSYIESFVLNLVIKTSILLNLRNDSDAFVPLAGRVRHAKEMLSLESRQTKRSLPY
jgi:hypothetical protein